MIKENNTLQGVVERILFEAPDSDYLVFRLRREDDDSVVTVTGNGSKPLVGDRLEVQGRWTEHRRYGRQYQAGCWKRLVPDTEEGMERFLASGAVKGIGPSLAHRIVEAFGSGAMGVLEKEPQRLLEIEGIGRKKLADITDSFRKEKEVNDIALCLETHGISGRFASRLVQKYGSDTQYVLEHEPYRMILEIEGIGFKTADQMALAFGLDPSSEERLVAGMTYVLSEMTGNGHVCIPDTELIRRTASVLRADSLQLRNILEEALDIGQLISADYGGGTYIYMPEMHDEECDIARRIQYMSEMKPLPVHTPIQLFLDRWQDICHFELAEKQREAVEASLQSGLLVITGGPGTGKTTVVQTIISLAEQEQLRIILCAPTGRAAKRLSETTERKALTIHRLLVPMGFHGRMQIFEYNETNLLKADLVIVDEVSMLDMSLMYHLFQALPPSCRVILVGDADQLPSVGAGSVLHDIIRSGCVSVIRLDTIFRQREGGRIVTNAHLINYGRMPVVNEDEEFRFITIDSESQGAEIISQLYESETSETGDKFAVQVLSPMYRQDCGVDHLNALIQEKTNPPSQGKTELKNGHTLYRTGDKVMQKQNDYEKGVFNGDIGEVFAVTDKIVYVRYPEHDVKYEGPELDEITLAYAITVHKSQGSEYQVVIMALVNSHAIMLQRNLLYTAVTRAKRKVILVGTKRALERAVENVRTSQRHTLLAERIRREEIT